MSSFIKVVMELKAFRLMDGRTNLQRYRTGVTIFTGFAKFVPQVEIQKVWNVKFVGIQEAL